MFFSNRKFVGPATHKGPDGEGPYQAADWEGLPLLRGCGRLHAAPERSQPRQTCPQDVKTLEKYYIHGHIHTGRKCKLCHFLHSGGC